LARWQQRYVPQAARQHEREPVLAHDMTGPFRVTVVGGGPAGLAAAEVLSAAGCVVQVFDAMPSFGRKFLMAGRGGLNITHSEPHERLESRYGAAAARLHGALADWTTQDIRDWMAGLEQESFVGSSGRVFPVAMKASPLLRVWLARLRAQGVTLRPRTRWLGWDAQGDLLLAGTNGSAPASYTEKTDALVLALGGASWPRLGSDGGWADSLAARGVELAPFQPANCGFAVAWSELFSQRFAGAPLKPVALSFEGRSVRGEVVLTAGGLEGGAVYALAAALRERVAAQGHATVLCDLRPDMSLADVAARLARVRARESLSNRLRKGLNLSAAAIGLLRESGAVPTTPMALAERIKALPIRLDAPQPLARAISTAGGVRWEACTEQFMLRALPGVFVAGEMLDWEAPTGGYLLHACLATGRAAAHGVLDWLRKQGGERYPVSL
jgi:uncharacterized flavoprotein (TIGR03862 family)